MADQELPFEPDPLPLTDDTLDDLALELGAILNGIVRQADREDAAKAAALATPDPETIAAARAQLEARRSQATPPEPAVVSLAKSPHRPRRVFSEDEGKLAHLLELEESLAAQLVLVRREITKELRTVRQEWRGRQGRLEA